MKNEPQRLQINMKKIIILFLIFVAALLLSFGGFIAWIHDNDYQPPKKELLQLTTQQIPTVIRYPRMHLATWNIGYAGLDKAMDFFYDGGSKTMTSAEQTDSNMAGILNILKKNESIDIWLLQEVDKKAKRSYWKDETKLIAEAKPQFNAVFATNYKVPFVPMPVTNPMGQVEAGLMSLSLFTPTLCRRHAYPELTSWPKRLFLLDRCFIEMRLPISTGKELIIINTHNSAFISDQSSMDKELAVLRNLMMTEFYSGNYVIVAGDWNMNPYHFEPSGDYNGHRFVASPVNIGRGFMPQEWQIVSDGNAPSNRFLNEPYVKGTTGTTTIDFFVLSPNIKLNKVITVDLGFEFSDHNPVFIDIELKGMQ